MKVWVRLLLFVLLLGAVAAATFYVCDHFLRQSVAGPVNYHYWIHRELGLNAKQESDLEPIEAKFAGRRYSETQARNSPELSGATCASLTEHFSANRRASRVSFGSSWRILVASSHHLPVSRSR